MKRILFQGDSITDCSRNREVFDSLGRGYAAFCAGELGLKYPGEFECLNRGISGNRIADLYAREKIDLINLAPEFLSILIGVNDVWHEVSRKNGFDEAKFERLYDILISDVREALPETKILIMGPFVLLGSATENNEEHPQRWDYFSAEVPLRAAASERVAEKYGLSFLPLQRVFDEACRRAPASFWLKDGVHPTPAGHALIRNEWIPAFERLAGLSK